MGMKGFEKRIKADRLFVHRTETDSFSGYVLPVGVVLRLIDEARTDMESNATCANKDLIVIDRNKWNEWFGDDDGKT